MQRRCAAARQRGDRAPAVRAAAGHFEQPLLMMAISREEREASMAFSGV
jgi:hypothetical protein